MKYIVYNKNTNKIIRTGNCAENHIPLQAITPDEAVVPTTADVNDNTHYMVGGVPVLNTVEMVAEQKAQENIRRAKAEAFAVKQNNDKNKLVNILKYLKSQGIDLGPSGEDL